MPDKLFLKPRADLKVPDPDRQDYLPPEGREVPDTPYWRRRLSDKEVSLAEKTESEVKSKKSKSKTAASSLPEDSSQPLSQGGE